MNDGIDIVTRRFGSSNPPAILVEVNFKAGDTRIDKTAGGGKPGIFAASLAGINDTFGGVTTAEKRQR